MLGRLQLREGSRIVGHAWKARVFGAKTYPGDAEAVCRAIVEACWEPRKGYYRTSLHNYPLFYSRDFGMCVDSLLALGERERAKKTLRYALGRYRAHGRVTQQISPHGKPFNFPDAESPDALAFLLRSLAVLKDKELVEEYRGFLEKEIARFAHAVVDPATGLAKRHMHLGGMRDFSIRDSSCYDNAMIAAISKHSDILRIKNPLKKYDYQRLLLERFWTGTYFRDDLSNDAMTGDANVAPLWLGVLRKEDEKRLFPDVLESVRALKLDDPYPLRYEAEKESTTRMLWIERFMAGWERDTAWLHLGNMWLEVVARHDPRLAREYVWRYRDMIEGLHAYPEVLTRTGEYHRSAVFHSDDSMLWAANWLAMQTRR